MTGVPGRNLPQDPGFLWLVHGMLGFRSPVDPRGERGIWPSRQVDSLLGQGG